MFIYSGRRGSNRVPESGGPVRAGSPSRDRRRRPVSSACSSDGAAPLKEGDIAPAAVMTADAAAGAGDAEAGLLVQADAGGVLGEDAGLERPDAPALR